MALQVLYQYLRMVEDWVENNMPQTKTDPHFKYPPTPTPVPMCRMYKCPELCNVLEVVVHVRFCEESSLDFLHSNGGQYQQAMDSLSLGYTTLSRRATHLY